MKMRLNRTLFWFLKDNAEVDLADSGTLDMYVQQVVSQGRIEDVKDLLANVDIKQLKQVFSRIKRFLSWEVRAFWEDFFADH